MSRFMYWFIVALLLNIMTYRSAVSFEAAAYTAPAFSAPNWGTGTSAVSQAVL